jgi:formamidopyrimidine-DNA glycosylase
MPELPDITVYTECLQTKVQAARLMRVRLQNPFLLRTALPPIERVNGLAVQGIERLGKRVVIALEDELFLVLHLMIAGRLHWHTAGGKPPAKNALALFEFESGVVSFTEAGTRRLASLQLVAGREALAAMDPGGIDVMRCTLEDFATQLAAENHTLKRSLTSPHLFSGIGNAYSDEVLHRARLSPVALTRKLEPEAVRRLLEVTRSVLTEWTERLRRAAAANKGWPPKVTAFHPQMAVHGRYGLPCPDCGHKVQRIVHASNETNYCAHCQTGGKLLADRALSKLLHKSWPQRLDDL